MKTYILALLGLFAVQSLAQTLPACAENCALSGISGSGCPVTNATCICDSATFISSYTSCVGKSCNATDAQAAAAYGVAYCASAGVTIATAASTAPATSSAASMTSAMATTAMATTSATGMATTEAAPTSATSAPATFTGGAAGPMATLLGYSWIVLGVGGAVALGV